MSNYLLDTNICLRFFDKILNTYKDSNIFLCETVLSELDNQKSRDGEVGYLSRRVIRTLFEIKKYGNYNEFIQLENGNRIKYDPHLDEDLNILYENNDDRIISSLSYCNKVYGETTLISNDFLISIKASGLGFKTMFLEDDDRFLYDEFRGIKFIDLEKVPPKILSQHYENPNENIFGLVENEYLILMDNGKRKGEIKRWGKGKFNRLKYKEFAVEPKDDFQACALDLLCNREIPIKIITGKFGSGKSQPLYSKILTPTGFVEMGSLSIGDLVIGQNGVPTKITGIFPQGIKDNYRIYFTDDSYTECCDDHLWKYRTYRNQSYKVDSLKNIMDKKDVFIPNCKPIIFNENKHNIPPYLLGIILGDNFVIDEISSKLVDINSNLFELDLKLYDTHFIKQELMKLGLLNEKFIPKEYLLDSVQNRKDLLSGLLDSESKLGESLILEYKTKSEKFKDDIVWLLNSLGRRCKIKKLNEDYVIYINSFEEDMKVKKIEKIGQTEMQCISVENEDHLYITDNFIVTHNTFLSCQQLFKDFRDNKYNKLVLCRQAEGDTDSEQLGYLKGGYSEKSEPFFMPIMDNLGFDAYSIEAMQKKEELEMVIPYYLKGRSFNGDVAIYVDEAEDLTIKTLKLIGSRIGQNEKGESGTVVFAGDYAQTEKKYQKNNGLLFLINKTKDSPLVGYVDLDVDYRSEASKVFADL